MDDFFELARSKGYLTPQGPSHLRDRKAKLLDFAIEAAHSLPAQTHADATTFGFLANTPLSGGYFPCSEIGCRLKHVDHLARFAALYADHVVLRNPFAEHFHPPSVDILRQRLAGDIAVLHYLEPLVKAGLVSFAAPSISLCASCSKTFKMQKDRLICALDEAGEAIVDQFLPDTTFRREKTGYLGVRGPDEFVTHGAQFFYLSPSSKYQGRLTPAKKRAFLWNLVSPLLDDALVHHLNSRHSSFNYLTDRRLDVSIARAIGGPAVTSIDRTLARGLAHSVPIVNAVSIDDILRLREVEREAFHVYRHAIASLTREADLTTPASITAAFEERIRPELAGLDLAVRNAQKIARRGLVKDIAVGAAAVSIGMLVGAVQPAMGAVLAAFGGGSALRSVVDKVVDASAEPSLVRANSFYFLWKLSRSGRGRAKIVVKS